MQPGAGRTGAVQPAGGAGDGVLRRDAAAAQPRGAAANVPAGHAAMEAVMDGGDCIELGLDTYKVLEPLQQKLQKDKNRNPAEGGSRAVGLVPLAVTGAAAAAVPAGHAAANGGATAVGLSSETRGCIAVGSSAAAGAAAAAVVPCGRPPGI